MLRLLFIAPIGCLILALASANSHAAGMVPGARYAAMTKALKAAPPPSSLAVTQEPDSYSGSVIDIGGTLSGTIGGEGKQSAVIISGSDSSVVDFRGAPMPPLGAQIRLLARMPAAGAPPSAPYTLIAWAFADGVKAATAKAVSPSAESMLRKAGPEASRGGFDHTQYLQAYERSISQINPRLSSSEVADIATVLITTSSQCDVDPRLVMAVVLAESGFNPDATSSKGAMGLGQLMPGTARDMGVTNPYDSTQNLDASIHIIRAALNKYSGNAKWKDLNWNHLRLALAAYNAGSGAVRKYGGVPPYKETQNYISRVIRYFKQLCGGS